MANNSPTLVMASLSDDQLKKSINSLVTHVDEAMKKMVQSTNNAVGEMEAKLKSLGNLKIDSGGSADGGSSKRTKAQNEETAAVEKTITARGKQIKQNQEAAMSFDQIAAALDKARRTVSDFNTKRASGILPSSEDYKRYEQALARIVEYNDKLKQSALSRADANQWANAFDAKRVISDISAVDDRYKKLVRWYTVLEKEDQRRIARDDKDTQKRIANAEKERAAREKMIESARRAEQKYQDATLKSAFRGALTLPTNNIDELRYKIERITTLTSTLRKEGIIDESQVNRANAAVAKLNEQLNKQLATEKEVKVVQSQQAQPQVKSARDSYIAFMQGYKQQAEQIRRLMEEEQKAMQQRRQGVVDGFTKTIEERKARIKELSEEIAKLYKERPDGYRDAIKQRTEEMNVLKQKIRELAEAQKNLADSPIGASNRYLELEREYNRIKNIMIDTTNIQRQSTQETEKQTQSAQRYTEEIRKQAQAIRESQQWKEKGVVTINGVDIYNLENSTKRRIPLEEQLVALLHEEETTTSQVAQEQLNVAKNAAVTNEQLEKARALSNKGIGTTANAKDGTVPTFTTQLESANALSKRLKELKEQYNSLSFGKRLSAEGQAIAQQIREITRQGQKLNNELNRPTKKEVFGLSEKTLDDIAYKMRQLSAYRGGLDASKQTREITQVNDEYNRLKKRMDEVMQKNQSMIASNNALGRSWNYMKNRLAFYVTVGAGTQFIKNLIEIRSQYEMNEKALGILLDSASRGTRIFNELSQMSLVSPYTLIELSNAAKQLTAYDIAAKDVVDTTRRLADMASAVGVPVERLTYALGQIKAYGYLNSRDARMFANAGIPLVKQLADYYSELEGKMVSTADVYDRMKKKAIDYADVMKVVTKMTDEGGKFFDFQAKMADTLKVRLANLTLAWNNMLNELGKSNQGTLTTGIKSLTVIFRHWREIYRILSTLIVALGAYKAATMLAGMATKGSIGRNAMASWMLLKRNIDAATGATAKFSVVLKSIPFTAWVTTIATLASYFYLFNNSTDGLKQKLEDIATAFDGVRKEITDLYADALKSDNIGSQLTKLRDMLELAQTELGVTIPINIEDVNESNIKQKLKEAKRFIDDYINFSQTFSEAAAGTKFNELMNEFGASARSTYTNISESINTVVVALQKLVDKGNASKRDIEILNELTSGQKEDESRIEYLQRLIRLYEELGLVGKKVTTPSISFFSSSTTNMDELTTKQNKQLDRLGVKNKQVFENMLKDVQGYYSSSAIAQYQFEQQVERVAKKIDINNIPEEQRTVKLSAAINEEASLNNWNQFEKEFARQIANQKFGTSIVISDESKSVAETELHDWQKRQQAWMDKNGINVKLNFQTNDTEVSYASRMLQAAKDAQEEVAVQQRKLKVGTGTQEALDAATTAAKKAREEARAAGADLSSLEKKTTAAAKKAESELSRALKDELSTIDKVRSIYKDLTKEGMSHANAVERATRGWDNTVDAINRVLKKNGLQKLDLSKFAGIENPRELVNMLQSQLNTLLKRGAKPAEIKELQTKIQTLNVDAEKYDLTKITKGLNNELGKLKDEYELAVELDANPELGDMFAQMFGLDTNDFPRTIGDYMNRVQQEFDKARMKLNLGTSLNVFKANTKQWYDWGKAVGYSKEQVDDFKKSFDGSVGVAKKWVQDVVKQTQDLQYKLADNNGKIAIEEEKLAVLRQRLAKETNEQQKKLLDLQIQDQENAIAKLKEEILQMLPTYQRLFGEVAEHSAWMTRKLARDYKNMLVEGKNRGLNADNTYSVRDPISGQITRLTKERMGKEIKNADKELQKTQSTIKKITEAFTKGDDKVVDWVHGVELVGEELGKLGQFVDVVGQIADAFGNPDEYNATAEAIHDISTSLQGASTVAQGIGQFASGDYIGGATNILSGAFTAISAWMDNSDKKIQQQIKNSERAIKKLELAYIDLEHAISNAYGTATIGAQMAAIANKELQLAELRRQLALEESRKSKDRDTDRIIELQKQIKELEYDIKDTTKEIVNSLLGITSVGNAAEELVSSMISAFRNGEKFMDEFQQSFDDMIDNMVMKSIVGKVIGDRLEKMFEQVEAKVKERAENILVSHNYVYDTPDWVNDYTKTAKEWHDDLMKEYESGKYTEQGKELIKRALDRINKIMEQSDAITPSDVEEVRNMANGWKDNVKAEFQMWMDAFGIRYGQDSNKELSALQQGIQGITEDTAGALEAYMNGVSQQVYYHSSLLEQIRDSVVGLDLDVSLGVQSQMLLQLQNSYQTQQAIQQILEGVLVPSGRAFSVELVS